MGLPLRTCVIFPISFLLIWLNKMLLLWEIMIHETKLIMYKMFHLHFPKKVDIYALVCTHTSYRQNIMLEKCEHMNFNVFFTLYCTIWQILLSSTDNLSHFFQLNVFPLFFSFSHFSICCHFSSINFAYSWCAL